MKQEEISQLIQHYFTASKAGTEPYFDADQIDAILGSFEEEENYSHYETFLNLGLRLHPWSNDLKIRECKFCLINEEYDKALELLDNIVETNNFDMDVIRLECYCALDQYPKALEYVDYLCESDCLFLEDIFEFMASLLNEFDMREEAKDFIKRGMARYPDSLVLRDELCFVLELDGDYKEAIQVCNDLIDKEPYSYDYWFTLGRLYSLTNAFDEAIEAFDFALTCDESDDELKILKAYCLFMNENYAKALEVYSEINITGIAADRIKMLMADCYTRLERFEQSYWLLKDLIYREVADAYTYVHFIRCCAETDRGKEAKEVLAKAVSLFPDNVRILSLLALSYIENGREDMALSITRKIANQLDDSSNEDDIVDNYERFLKKILPLSPSLALQRSVPPEDLAKHYLSNKKNSN